MNAPTNYQIIKNPNGTPAFVVVPYDEYRRLFNPIDTETGVPSAVVNLAFDNDYSALRAWREYLGFTQEEVAKKLMISQSAYCQQEKNDTLTNAFRERVAIVLNIHPEQLNF